MTGRHRRAQALRRHLDEPDPRIPPQHRQPDDPDIGIPVRDFEHLILGVVLIRA